MNSKNLKKKKDVDLLKEVVSLKESLRESSFDLSREKSKGSSKNKKNIARILTELNSR